IFWEAPFGPGGLMAVRAGISRKARGAYVKERQAGDSAGYERAYKTDKPVWLATLPVGHADGLPRSVASGGRVRIGGRLYPVVASVSASHCIVEIGSEASVAIRDVATIFHAPDGSRPEDVAVASNASVYDLTMHLHANLPRRVL